MPRFRSLVVRRTWLSTVGDRAFPVTAAARVWNELALHVTYALSPSSFLQSSQESSFQPYLSRLVVVFVNFQVSLLYTSIAFVTYLYLHTYSTSVETPGPFGTFAPEPVLTILRPGGQLCDVSTEVARDWTTATLSRRAYNTQSPHSRLNVITSASPRASK